MVQTCHRSGRGRSRSRVEHPAVLLDDHGAHPALVRRRSRSSGRDRSRRRATRRGACRHHRGPSCAAPNPALTKRPTSLRLPRRSVDTRRRSRRTHRACGRCHRDESSRGTALLNTRPASSSHLRSEVPPAEPERERVSASSEVHTVVAGARPASPAPHSVSPSPSPRRPTYGSARGPKNLERSA
jgi:hypothetical protein